MARHRGVSFPLAMHMLELRARRYLGHCESEHECKAQKDSCALPRKQMPSLCDPQKESASGRRSAQGSVQTSPVEIRPVTSFLHSISIFFFFGRKRKLHSFKAVHFPSLSPHAILVHHHMRFRLIDGCLQDDGELCSV